MSRVSGVFYKTETPGNRDGGASTTLETFERRRDHRHHNGCSV